jgi:glycosyltransferase involved in cell wall biosynthesis
MRIIMIGQKGIPMHYGGIERHVEELSLKLVAQGHEVLAYARNWYTPKKINQYHGIKVVHTFSIHTKNLDAISHTFFSTINALFQKPDVIHYHGVGPALLAWIPRVFAPKVKVVATFHSIDRYHQKWGFIAKMFLRLGEWAACRFPHETIVVSKTIQSYCWNEFQRETTYIPNGVTATCSAPFLLSRWGLEGNKYVLMVARLIPHKGAHYLIEAWQHARATAPEILKDYKLVIAGGGHYTEKYVKQLHETAKDDSSVVFTGWVKGRVLEELFSNTALFVYPSVSEGLPIVVLEAMSCARAVLASDIPEHQEIIADDRFWFTSADAKALSSKLIELLKQPELLKQAGEKNRVLAEQNYNWDAIAEKAEKVYSASK